MKDFFVSFTHADKGWADWISWELEAAGFTVEYQPWDFLPAEDFIGEMTKALAQCERVVAVLSPAYFESEFARAEWRAALASDPLGEKRRLIQVRVREVEIPALTTTRIYIDLKEVQDEEEARRRLLDATKDRLKPEQKPQFPGGAPALAALDGEKPPFPPAQAGGTPAPPIPPPHRPWRAKAAWFVGVVAVPLLAALIGIEDFRNWALSPFSSEPEGFSSTSVEFEKQNPASMEIRVLNSGNRPSEVVKSELVLLAEDVGAECAMRHPMAPFDGSELPKEVAPMEGGVPLELKAGDLQPEKLCDRAGSSHDEWFPFIDQAPWRMVVVIREQNGDSKTLEVENAFLNSRRFVLNLYAYP